ncbi:hypothetical protein [Phenylobacterium sp.]|jgi:hypothetical protein|uniref:hypothetical protein n=1 Tax=Phenylobacterium sp. TaxID=1871053 RepID=UPI0037833357
MSWKQRATAIWLRVSFVLAVLGLLNVAEYLEWIQHFTTSLKWLAAWWRFLVDAVLGWLPFRLTSPQRDMLVIVGLLVSAANIQAHRQYGRTLFELAFRYTASGGDEDPYQGKKLARTTHWLGWSLASLVLLGLWFVAWPAGLLLTFSVACYLRLLWLLKHEPPPPKYLRYRLGRAVGWVTFAVMLYAGILGGSYLRHWLFAASYPRLLLTGLGVVFVILGGNAAMLAFGDPLAWLPDTLPPPPR